MNENRDGRRERETQVGQTSKKQSMEDGEREEIKRDVEQIQNIYIYI